MAKLDLFHAGQQARECACAVRESTRESRAGGGGFLDEMQMLASFVPSLATPRMHGELVSVERECVVKSWDAPSGE